jgi:hypothetical protein
MYIPGDLSQLSFISLAYTGYSLTKPQMHSHEIPSLLRGTATSSQQIAYISSTSSCRSPAWEQTGLTIDKFDSSICHGQQ